MFQLSCTTSDNSHLVEGNQYLVDVEVYINNSNVTSFFRFVSKRAIYRLVIISLAHAPVHVTDFPVINVHELSSARNWQHTLCATYSANVNINNHLPITVYYRICTLRHTRIELIHESQNVF